MSPIAPFRDTALGLKFDSTFTTARTRLGSTLWRAAACSMAVSISIDVAAVWDEFAATILAFADWLDSCPRYWVTSAAADRAARMIAAFGRGTGFQRFSLELQYISERRGVTGVSVLGAEVAETKSFT